MKRYLFLVIAALQVQLVNAQSSQKIGHADWEFIFSKMPEVKIVEEELRVLQGQLENQLKLKNQEFEAKYNQFKGLPSDTPEAIRKDKETELAHLQQNIQQFQQDAQSSIQKKQNNLMTPVFSKVAKAIEEVARENGYAYIINPRLLGGDDVLLYTDERYNISNLVLQKLGVKVGG